MPSGIHVGSWLRRLRRCVVVAAAVSSATLGGGVLGGCGPLRSAARTDGARDVSVADGPAPARCALVACTYGGPRRLGRHDPAKVRARVVAVVELEAQVPLAGVTVAALEVFDSSGGRIGYGVLPATVRHAPAYQPPAEPLDAETAEFDGRVAPGRPVRLWIDATLDVSPARVQTTLDLGGGRQLQVAGRVGALWTG